MAAGIPLPLLRDQPVQALGATQRAEGGLRRQPLAARRLARALGRQRARVAAGAGEERSGKVIIGGLLPQLRNQIILRRNEMTSLIRRGVLAAIGAALALGPITAAAQS